MFSRLVMQITECEGVTEQLKASNQIRNTLKKAKYLQANIVYNDKLYIEIFDEIFLTH